MIRIRISNSQNWAGQLIKDPPDPYHRPKKKIRSTFHTDIRVMSPLDSQEEIRQVHEPRDAAQEEVGEGGQRRRGYDGTLQAGAARPVPGQVCTVPYLVCGIRLLTSKVPVPHTESLADNYRVPLR